MIQGRQMTGLVSADCLGKVIFSKAVFTRERGEIDICDDPPVHKCPMDFA